MTGTWYVTTEMRYVMMEVKFYAMNKGIECNVIRLKVVIELAHAS